MPSTPSQLTGIQVAVAPGQVEVSVPGSYPTPYEVAATPNWNTTVSVVGKTASIFTLQFATPAPPAGGSVDVFFVTPTTGQGFGPAILAGDLITNVRWKIPDPVLDANGNPLPDGNGAWPAQALYGWLDDALRELNRLIGSQVEDWTAIAQRNMQPWYDLDPHFLALSSGFSLQWPLDIISLSEADTIWPAAAPTGQATSQSLWGYIRKRTNALAFGLWPTPNQTDPVTTLTSAIGTGVNEVLDLVDITNFLSFGYVQIDNEILQYQTISGNTLSVLSRGTCGTTAASHVIGAAVQQLGLWLKGVRTPARVFSALSPVEISQDLTQVLKDYVLAQVRQSENEFTESDRLMKQFDRTCAQIKADPNRVQQTGLIGAYAEAKLGTLGWPNSGGVVIP